MAAKTGIDIGSSSLKFAQVSIGKQEVKVERALSFPLPGSEEENFSDACALRLRDYLKKQKFKVGECLAGISGKHLSMRYLQAPSINESRIKELVEMEMAQVLEKANTPLAYSYIPLKISTDSKQQGCVVAIAVVYESFLEMVGTFFCKAGIKIHSFVPDTIALHHAFSCFSEISSRETTYIADIGYENTNLLLSQGETLYFARNVNMGSKIILLKIQEEKNCEFQEAEKFAIQKVNLASYRDSNNTAYNDGTIAFSIEENNFEEMLLSAAQKIPDAMQASLKFAKVQTGISALKIDRILLAGGGALQRGMKEIIKDSFTCPIGFFSWKNLSFDSLPEEEIREDQKYFFIASIGLAHLVHQKKIPLKILSYGQKIQELLLGKHLFEYLSLAAMFLLVLFCLWTTFACLQRYSKWEEQLQEKYTKLSEKSLKNKEIQKENDLLQNKISMIQDKIVPNKTVLEILSWLQNTIPSQMHLDKIEWKYDSGFSLSLHGFVEESTEDVYIVLKRFKESIKKHAFLVIEEEKDPRVQDQERKLEFFLRLGLKK